MKLDIISIIKNVGASIEFSKTENLQELETGIGTVEFISPVVFSGKVTSQNGMVKLEGVAQTDYRTVCDCCGENLERHLTVTVQEDIIEKDDSPSKEADTDTDAEDDRFSFSGHMIELDMILVDAILLNLPMQYLCSEDCSGLCTVCGEKNQHCNCTSTDTTGSKFDLLKDYFDR